MKLLIIRYYLRRIAKFITSQFMAWLLFAVSLSLFFLILFPNLAHRVPFFGQWDFALELEGAVYRELSIEGGNFARVPIGGASIEIGGYRVSTSAEGTYRLKFVARDIEDIPVVISVGDSSHVRKVSFPRGQFTVTRNFILR